MRTKPPVNQQQVSINPNNNQGMSNANQQVSNVNPNSNVGSSQIINDINSQISRTGSATVHITTTTGLTSAQLSQISDLSKVKITLDGQYYDINGNLQSKYGTKQRYIDRVTYTGYEMMSIVQELERMESMVDKNAPASIKAKQIYNIIASEYRYVFDYGKYPDGHNIVASLRGVSSNNAMGKKGLVCAGYAALYKEMCTRCGVTCDYVRGRGVTSNGSETHAWNVVIDENGNIIPVDVCWKAGGSDYFGASQKFAESHIADADELFRDYRNPLKVGEQKNNNVPQQTPSTQKTVDINSIISSIDSKYGSGVGYRKLADYLVTGDLQNITRSGGAREMLANVTPYKLKEIIMQDIFTTMSSKYGVETAAQNLKDYAITKGEQFITRTNNARTKIGLLDPKYIQEYLKRNGY